MTTFGSLKKLLRSADPTKALPSDPFVVVDREATIELLKLDERARENGTRNLPPPDSTTFDEVEQEIVAEIGELADRAKIDAGINHRVYGERLSELALLREVSSITGATAEALGDFRTTVLNQKNRLALARDAIGESYDELKMFKQEHGLRRPAHEGIGTAYAASTIALSWFVESIANTAFLRINDDFGLLGGFVAAAVVAAVNVFLSALVGRFWWPQLLHRRLSRRLVAALGVAGWAVLLVIWNLLAGHFRDAKAAGMERPEEEAIGLLLDNTWHFASIYSYGLLFAGIAFAFLAAIAAFKMKDPYPGYGDIWKRHQDRCNEYSQEIAGALEELRDTRNSAIDDASGVRDELSRQFGERGQIISARDAHRNRFREHQDYLEGVGRFLLSYYRSANLRSRSDGLVPAHFNSTWSMSRTELPLVADEGTTENEVRRAQDALMVSIQTIASAYDKAIDSFESLDQIKRSLANG